MLKKSLLYCLGFMAIASANSALVAVRIEKLLKNQNNQCGKSNVSVFKTLDRYEYIVRQGAASTSYLIFCEIAEYAYFDESYHFSIDDMEKSIRNQNTKNGRKVALLDVVIIDDPLLKFSNQYFQYVKDRIIEAGGRLKYETSRWMDRSAGTIADSEDNRSNFAQVYFTIENLEKMKLTIDQKIKRIKELVRSPDAEENEDKKIAQQIEIPQKVLDVIDDIDVRQVINVFFESIVGLSNVLQAIRDSYQRQTNRITGQLNQDFDEILELSQKYLDYLDTVKIELKDIMVDEQML